MVRLKNGEQISNLDTINSIARQNKRKYNQWDLADLSIYHFYCCPECSYRSPKDFLFRDHMNENHETVISKRIKTSVSSLIQRFLEDEKDIQSKYNELNLPENIDVIKNPHFKLPLPNFSQSSPETSAIFQSQSLKVMQSTTPNFIYKITSNIKKFLVCINGLFHSFLTVHLNKTFYLDILYLCIQCDPLKI